MSRAIRHTAIGAVVATVVFIAPPGPVQASDAKHGKQISEQQCSRCHVVGDYNPTGGISSTPSFQLLVKRRPDYRERFQSFHVRRPHPAFVIVKGVERLMPKLPTNAAPLNLTLEDIDAIVAFIETLKPEK